MTIPDSFTIQPLGSGVAFVGASSNGAITFAGSGAISDVAISGFALAISAAHGAVAISGVQLSGDPGVPRKVAVATRRSPATPPTASTWRGALTTTHATITGNGIAVTLRSGDVFGVTMRGTTISNNTQGLVAVSDPTSTLDFGTAADPGNNTFTASASQPNFSLQTSLTAAAMTIDAIGNTFDANTQGADANGHYAATTLAARPAIQGQNVTLIQGGTAAVKLSLVLAQ